MAIFEIRMSDDEKEGTKASLGTWFKKPGEAVSRHEPLGEIDTDKVTLEIAAPASGVIRELLKQSGDAVLAGELLGTIESGSGDNSAVSRSDNICASEETLSAKMAPRTSVDACANNAHSPAVRKLLSELGLDPRDIPKTTRGGRLTPEDVGAFLKKQLPRPASAPEQKDSIPAGAGRRVAHTPMRRSIANHMLHSMQSAPHVTSVFEADLYNLLADRQSRKVEGDGDSIPSVTAYLIRAALQAINLVPEVNSKWHETYLEIFDHVNFGVGTALDRGGLVVPVIHKAHEMDLVTLSKNLHDMTAKARAGKLTRADMEGGTFTLSNHGVSGSLLAAPIILPYGQAAILGAGKVQKRVIVCESGGRELFRIRPMIYVTLTVDHRVLDGQQANGFLTEFVRALESSS